MQLNIYKMNSDPYQLQGETSEKNNFARFVYILFARKL